MDIQIENNRKSRTLVRDFLVEGISYIEFMILNSDF